MLHVVTSGVDHKMGTISLRTDRGFFHCCCRQLTNAHVMAWPAAAGAVAGHTRACGIRPEGDMNVACAALHEKLICYNQYHDKADAGGKRSFARIAGRTARDGCASDPRVCLAHRP